MEDSKRFSKNACRIHNQKHHRLAASCGFYQLDASCQQVEVSLLTSSSCSKQSVKIKLVIIIIVNLSQLFTMVPK